LLTIFAIPRPFVGEFDELQRNAIRSWTLLQPTAEIILFGSDKGTAEVAKELNLRHAPLVAVNEWGTPLLDDLFSQAQNIASHKLLAYVNSDIILMDDFMDGVSRVSQRAGHFVLGGRRWNLGINGLLSFDSGWQEVLRSQIRICGTLHWPTGIDYFVFPKGTWETMPPFAIGRTMWDNWLLYYARARGYALIDASEIITAVHQTHSYPQDLSKNSPEKRRNWELANGIEYAFTLEDATHRLTKKGLKRCFRWRDLQQKLQRFPVLHPRQKIIASVARRLFLISQLATPRFQNQRSEG
jgi:hypothetical protein